MSKALELMWTGRIFDAQEALAMGYVTRVVPGEELMEQTLDFANDICKMPAVSVQLIKRLAYRSAVTGLHEALEMADHADGYREIHAGRDRGSQGLLREARAGVQGVLTPGPSDQIPAHY